MSSDTVAHNSGPAPIRPRVLVVDDDPVSLEVLLAQVDRCGYETLSAGSVQQAQDRLGSVSAVVVDLHLPDGPGHALAAATSAPVVLVTGAISPNERQQARVAGCAAVLEKPIRMAALSEALRRALP